jgi:hypothetical protein
MVLQLLSLGSSEEEPPLPKVTSFRTGQLAEERTLQEIHVRVNGRANFVFDAHSSHDGVLNSYCSVRLNLLWILNLSKKYWRASRLYLLQRCETLHAPA